MFCLNIDTDLRKTSIEQPLLFLFVIKSGCPEQRTKHITEIGLTGKILMMRQNILGQKDGSGIESGPIRIGLRGTDSLAQWGERSSSVLQGHISLL